MARKKNKSTSPTSETGRDNSLEERDEKAGGPGEDSADSFDEDEDDDEDDDGEESSASSRSRSISAAPRSPDAPRTLGRKRSKSDDDGEEAARPDEDDDEDDDAPAPSRSLPQRAKIATSRSLRAAPARADDSRAPRMRIEEPEEDDDEPLTLGERFDSLLKMQIGGKRRPGLSSLAQFTRKLSALITAGIPLVRSLKLLSERTRERSLREATEAVARDVEAGGNLSESLKKHPIVFSPLVVSVVHIGEIGGILEESLRRLSEILDRKAIVRKQVKAAATYPVVLGVLAIAAVVVIMLTIVPQFETSFAQMNMELPKPTQLVIDISRHLQSYWHIDLIALALVFYLLKRYVSDTESGQRLWEKTQLRTPRIGGIVQLVNSARFCRTLGGLLSAGIPLWESLGVAAETSESALVMESLEDVRDAVEKGQKLEPTLRESRCFMPEMLDIVGIGEETGMLDKMLLSMADDYEEEIETRLATLIELLKPLLLIIIGGCIVLILVAVYLPYFNLVKGIGAK